jgi:hypothetical protein
VKGSIKGRYLRDARQSLFRRCNAGQAGGIVEGSQFCQLFDSPLYLGSDKHGAAVALAAMDNAVPDSSKLFKGMQSRRRTSLQILENLSRRVTMFL